MLDKNEIESDCLLESSNESRMPSCVLINHKLLGSISSYVVKSHDLKSHDLKFQAYMYIINIVVSWHLPMFSTLAPDREKKKLILLLLEVGMPLSYSWC